MLLVVIATILLGFVVLVLRYLSLYTAALDRGEDPDRARSHALVEGSFFAPTLIGSSLSVAVGAATAGRILNAGIAIVMLLNFGVLVLVYLIYAMARTNTWKIGFTDWIAVVTFVVSCILVRLVGVS